MIASGVVSIPSAVGSSTVFTVVGTRTLMYARAFQAYLDAALAVKTLNIQQGDTVGGTVSFDAALAGSVNEAVLKGAGSLLSTTVPGGYQFLFDNYSGASSITGAATGGDVLVAAINAAATYFDEGGNNTVVFVDGNNHYVGNTTSAAGTDTIVAGSGFDTIDTGYGQSTVDSGTGRAVINLHDTTSGATGSVYNAYVYLDDGLNTVNANGMRDAIVATAPGQTIDGGLSASQYDGIVLVGGNGNGNDVINDNGATIAVFDDSSGNSIFGGSGQMIFVGGAGVSASIVGGTGRSDIFGGVGDSIVFAAGENGGSAVFVAGAGNESLIGALSQRALSFYGYNGSEASITSGVQEQFVGGAGNDTLVSGAGHETLTGGGGDNVFLIDATTDGVGGNIVITDFGASSGNLLGFENYTTAEIQQALNSAYTVTGADGQVNTILTLSDKTQVTFLDVSSLSGHTFGA